MATTIEERVEALMATLPYLHVSQGGVKGFRERLRLTLLEVARDQRHACIEAMLESFQSVPAKGGNRNVNGGSVYNAIMNAEIGR